MTRVVRVLAAALVAAGAACGTRGAGGASGPIARPAPVEIDWPDAAPPATPPPAIDAGAR